MGPNEKTVPHIGGEAPNVRYCSLRGSHFVSKCFNLSHFFKKYQIFSRKFRDTLFVIPLIPLTIEPCSLRHLDLEAKTYKAQCLLGQQWTFGQGLRASLHPIEMKRKLFRISTTSTGGFSALGVCRDLLFPKQLNPKGLATSGVVT